MMLGILALLLGVVAGLRAMTVPAAVSWAAHLGVLNLTGTGLAFLGNAWMPWVLSVLALGELVTDQLPATPSRTVPVQFVTRLIVGALAGAALGLQSGDTVVTALAGVAGAILGTLGGRAARRQLARAFGRDRPAAIVEDIVAVGGAVLLMAALS